MEELLKNSPIISIPKLGSLIEGTIISKQKNKLLVDIDGINTGIIAGREAHDSTETLKEIGEGDKVQAIVIDNDSPEGLIVLSLRKASQEKTWKKFTDAYENGVVIEVIPNEANKGGLLLEVDGIKGFIPVSQLAPLNYPRVNGSDAAKILTRLERLVGKVFKTKILSIDRENGKLILSERSAFEQERRDALKKLREGQKVKGRISGIVDFGIFVAFEHLEGLVHISEIAWGHVSNPSEYGKLGDEVEILVIGIDNEKISLSMKRLTPDPWIEAAKTFKIGKIVEGTINRITQFGAFLKLNDEINGLIHLSEITTDEIKDINKMLNVGQKVTAKIINVDLDEHRIGLSIKAINEKEEDKKDIEEDKKENKEEKEPAKKSKSKNEDDNDDDDMNNLDISDKVKKTLNEAGYNKISDLKNLSLEDLTNIEGIGEKSAKKIQEQI
ncbi:hypothetical protein A2229_03840 [Candidatus Peregrinibacteria bacterium RIFOXYA2_FULL_33_7]|nr:MAG: hypothetical protein A2229_03840 [Candidatus Peregrinibacteria bacterium RIFOXYA2_FULL_33_7]